MFVIVWFLLDGVGLLCTKIVHLRVPRRRRFAGAEGGSRVLQCVLNGVCRRVCAAEDAPRDPFNFLEPHHGLADLVERGDVPVDR